jgi:hypothetical protein
MQETPVTYTPFKEVWVVTGLHSPCREPHCSAHQRSLSSAASTTSAADPSSAAAAPPKPSVSPTPAQTPGRARGVVGCSGAWSRSSWFVSVCRMPKRRIPSVLRMPAVLCDLDGQLLCVIPLYLLPWPDANYAASGPP